VSIAVAPALRRDVQVISLVGLAHGLSHFFQLSLPPLFPLLRDELGVGYAALGAVMSLFYIVSAIGQTSAGFLVDRFGARPILLGGIALFGASIAGAALATSYWMLLPVAVAAGLGNSVFHPADFAIFNASVSPARLGRAYSVHSICGNVGWAAAPVVVVGLSAGLGWRGALVVVGSLGLVAALALGTQSSLVVDHRMRSAARRGPASAGLAADVRVLTQTPILMAFAYFALVATALIGMQTFSVSAMVAIHDAPLGLATGALTGFLLGGATGILAGGLVADRTRRHDAVAAGGMLVAAMLTLALATGAVGITLLTPIMMLTGLSLGVTGPSRDMLVRAATPPGASGKVYGFVYSGLDLGSAITPLLFGWMLDHGAPRAIFVGIAAFMLLTIATIVQVRRQAARPLPSAPLVP
jgi:FSR family fosmidomycin resistance protein-like MFS transporter